jgi:hypothetical protein
VAQAQRRWDCKHTPDRIVQKTFAGSKKRSGRLQKQEKPPPEQIEVGFSDQKAVLKKVMRTN